MDIEGLRTIEEKLDLKLPSEYVNFILSYPKLPDAEEQKYLEEAVFRDSEIVIRDNEFFRDELLELVSKTFDITSAWGKHLLLIGSDGCGNYYFLDTTRMPAPVRFFDHESGGLECLATDIYGLYRHIIDTSNEVRSWK